MFYFLQFICSCSFYSSSVIGSQNLHPSTVQVWTTILSNYFDNNYIQVYNTLMEAGKRPTSSLEIVTFMFVSNFIGIICARSLHYQFYVWYYHQLPLLVHCCGINLLISIPLLLGIEFCWNVYPSTVTSSSLLVLIHIFILFKLYTRSTSKPKVQ